MILIFFLLDEPVVYRKDEEWKCPENLRLAAYYKKEEVDAFHLYDRPSVSKEGGILSAYGGWRETSVYDFFLRFSGERQYGLLACDIQQEEFPFFYVISLQIGLSLRYLEISKAEAARRREMTKDLEVIRERNRILGIMSANDEHDRPFESQRIYRRSKKNLS